MSIAHKAQDPTDCPHKLTCTWLENSQLILSEIQRLAEISDDLRREVHEYSQKTESRISKLEVKAGIFGAIAGFLAALGAILLKFIKE